MDENSEIENLRATIAALEAALHAIQGEAIAVQAVVLGLCDGIVQSNPEARSVISHAFDYADRFAEIGVMNLGKKQPPAHLVGFMETLEQMRRAALGANAKPRGDL
jgi:hypothetical protein